MNTLENPEQNDSLVRSPYARKSFRNFVITFILLFIQMLSLMVLIGGVVSSIWIPMIAIFACFVLSVLGLIYGVKSVRKKESSKWLKYVGLVGNLILSSTLLTMLLYFLFSLFT